MIQQSWFRHMPGTDFLSRTSFWYLKEQSRNFTEQECTATPTLLLYCQHMSADTAACNVPFP